MKILLLTDMPPCTNYTAGIVLSQIVKVLPRGSVACYCAVDATLGDIRLDPELAWMPLRYAAKPREAGLPPGALGRGPRARLAERARRAEAVPRIVNECVAFARENGCDAVWGVLEGQTMVRVVPRVAELLGAPLYTHVWDPLEWWLKVFHVDPRTSEEVREEFDAALRRSAAVATASGAMSEEYERHYGVRSVALIACHDRANSFAPEPRLRKEGELVIGMAGQFYANAEWDSLVRAMGAADWTIGGRSVRLLVLGHAAPGMPVPPGRLRYVGWVPQEEAIRLLSEEADILFCPYPFAPDMAEVSRLSFPSKLVSYLAAGRPVVFHGPDFAAPARYLTERGAGLVTPGSGAANVFNAVERLATDPALYAAVATAARRAFLDDFTLERMRERTLSFFGTTMEALTPLRTVERAVAAPRLPDVASVPRDPELVVRWVLGRLERTPARRLVRVLNSVAYRLRRRRRAPFDDAVRRITEQFETMREERAAAEARAREAEVALAALRARLEAYEAGAGRERGGAERRDA